MRFPKGFVWGAATAAYQIEGAAGADGKGLSIWDAFVRLPSVIKDGSTGDIACDHYHRVGEDIALLRELGCTAYRFSVSWPRVMPDGVSVSSEGLDFYDRLVDLLLENGIAPYLTLYHWDLPLALHREGGWLNRSIAKKFGAYARLIGSKLGDRCKKFMTFNEPQVFLNAGYVCGTHAPGLKVGLDDELVAVHNVLLSHGEAVTALRETAAGAEIGWASAGYPGIPATDSPEDVRAAEAVTFVYPEDHPSAAVAVFADPIERGDYDAAYYRKYDGHLPRIEADDMRLIGQPIDFHGQNCYAGRPVHMGPDGPVTEPPIPGEPLTQMQWNILPECLYWFPKLLYARYGLPIYITENGVSYSDYVFEDGGVHDPARSDYIVRHLRALGRAAAEVPVRGYFYWSLLDNFEWAEGYTQRFGLVHVDFATGKRTRKDSFRTYREIIESRGEALK